MHAQPLGSVLVATDFSASGDRALERAAHLSLADGARVTLLHVIPGGRMTGGLSAARQRPLEDAAREALEATRARTAARSPGVAISTALRSGTPYVEITRHARDVAADLVVIGRRGRHPMRDLLLGSTAEQVVRNGETAVLLVRTRADRAYAKPLLALEHDESAGRVARAALRVLPAPPPALTVVHVDDLPFRGLAYAGLSQRDVEHDRASRHRRLRAELDAVLSRALPESVRYRIAIRDGSARGVILREVDHAKPDLVVLGTHGRSGPAFALLGSVAGEVLREVACDTFVTRPGEVTFQRP